LDGMARDCRGARLAYSLQLDGELPVRGCERLARHLRRCGSCRSLAHELEAICSCLRAGQQKDVADVAPCPEDGATRY